MDSSFIIKREWAWGRGKAPLLKLNRVGVCLCMCCLSSLIRQSRKQRQLRAMMSWVGKTASQRGKRTDAHLHVVQNVLLGHVLQENVQFERDDTAYQIRAVIGRQPGQQLRGYLWPRKIAGHGGKQVWCPCFCTMAMASCKHVFPLMPPRGQSSMYPMQLKSDKACSHGCASVKRHLKLLLHVVVACRE